jgi:putative FmdB family regulatory protein
MEENDYMPTYDYKCLECDVQFEKFQGITAPLLEECPECNGKVKRLIGAGAGLIFKGSGFYITDYRSDGYKESAKKDKNPPSEKSEKSDKKEKKTDTSSESKSKPSESG